MTSLDFVKLLGAMTYFFLLTTVLSGFLRKKFQYNNWIKFHKFFAISTVTLATIHAICILIFI